MGNVKQPIIKEELDSGKLVVEVYEPDRKVDNCYRFVFFDKNNQDFASIKIEMSSLVKTDEQDIEECGLKSGRSLEEFYTKFSKLFKEKEILLPKTLIPIARDLFREIQE